MTDIRLHRVDSRYLDVIGATCQMQQPWESEPCGGKLCVEDWRGRVSERWLNYELFCATCGTCDPDGWQTQAEVISAATSFGRKGTT